MSGGGRDGEEGKMEGGIKGMGCKEGGKEGKGREGGREGEGGREEGGRK